MSSTETTMNSKVETLDINLDEIFNGAPGGDTMTLPEEKSETPKQKNIFSGNGKSDFSFADPDKDDADDLISKVEQKNFLFLQKNLVSYTVLILFKKNRKRFQLTHEK